MSVIDCVHCSACRLVPRAAYRTTAYASLAHNSILTAVAVDVVDDSTGWRHLTIGARVPRRAHTHVVPA